jgi:hypothetical protein
VKKESIEYELEDVVVVVLDGKEVNDLTVRHPDVNLRW